MSGGKSPEAFRTISEVAGELDVPQHVLRFWETKFPQVKPLKRGGGRRYYRPDDVALLRRIRSLLYDDGYTIKGVQKVLREHGVRAVIAGAPSPGSVAPAAGAVHAAPAPSSQPEGETGQTAALFADLPAGDATTEGGGGERRDLPPAAATELRAVLDDLKHLRAILSGAGEGDEKKTV